jgi:hypothetical protein
MGQEKLARFEDHRRIRLNCKVRSLKRSPGLKITTTLNCKVTFHRNETSEKVLFPLGKARLGVIIDVKFSLNSL